MFFVVNLAVVLSRLGDVDSAKAALQTPFTIVEREVQMPCSTSMIQMRNKVKPAVIINDEARFVETYVAPCGSDSSASVGDRIRKFTSAVRTRVSPVVSELPVAFGRLRTRENTTHWAVQR